MDDPLADDWLFEVEEVFQLRGLGLVIVLDLELSNAVLRVGDTLVFLLSDGQEIETRLKQIPMISRLKDLPRRVCLELPKTSETLQIAAGDQAFRRGSAG